MRRPTLLRSITLGVGIVVAGICAGAVVAARFDLLGDPATLDRALREGELTKVAEIPTAPGRAKRSFFVQRSGGLFCVWDAPSATALTRQGGCNRESDPLAGNEFFISFSYDGGPDVKAVTDARLVGVASASVAAVDVAMSDGTFRKLSLRPARAAGDGLQAFAYRIGTGDLRRGVGPVSVRAFDEAGRQIGVEPTGFVE